MKWLFDFWDLREVMVSFLLSVFSIKELFYFPKIAEWSLLKNMLLLLFIFFLSSLQYTLFVLADLSDDSIEKTDLDLSPSFKLNS